MHLCLAFNFEHEHTSNDSQDIVFTAGSKVHKNVYHVNIPESENKHRSVKTLIMSSLTDIHIMCQTFTSLAQGLLNKCFL